MSQFNEPTAEQITKFYETNSMDEPVFNRRCASYNNCALCPMAIHQSVTKNHCTYGMSEMEFRLLMSSADCEY